MTESTCKFLESLHRIDLAMLMQHCKADVEERDTALDWFHDLEEEVVVVRAPHPIDEALKSLPAQDRKRIAEAVTYGKRVTKQHSDILVETLEGRPATGSVALLADLMIHREMMIAVATGGPRFDEVNDYYRAREARIRASLPSGVSYNNPHKDLWDWYNHYSNNLGQYRDRRAYIRALFAPTVEAVATRPILPSEPREATGWERVDRAMTKARSLLQIAAAEEDFQAVGLICREVIISLAQAVYDPEAHPSLDGVRPSATDANRMLEAYVAQAFPGESFKEVRAHARAALALALNLQHRRTANRQLASLCVEATASTAAVIMIIASPS